MTCGCAYQNRVASKKLLVFTNYRLYLKGYFGSQSKDLKAEVPGGEERSQRLTCDS